MMKLVADESTSLYAGGETWSCGLNRGSVDSS